MFSDYHKYHKNDDVHAFFKIFWKPKVETFFKRSGLYIKLFENEDVEDDHLYEFFVRAFKQKEGDVTYFAPLEYVGFSKPAIDLETYKIMKFSEDELDVLFENKINRYFYPDSVIDTKKLKDYWLLCLNVQSESTESQPEISMLELKMEFRFLDYPPSLLYVLQQLALFNWGSLDLISSESEEQPIEPEPWWEIFEFVPYYTFHVPFFFRKFNSLLNIPERAPDLSKLDTESREYGVPIHLDDAETEELERFLLKLKELISNLKIEENKWHFFNIALNYFTKAFFSHGIEQLLWHITSLEALMGEKGEGVTERLTRRIAIILAQTKNDRKKIRKWFKELYDLRCELVHGKYFNEKVDPKYLCLARDITRRSVLWFIIKLSKIQDEVIQTEGYDLIPTREDILSVMDMEESEKHRIHNLLGKLIV